jgi:putative PIN family toxin of toxin-antitoxin system
MSPRAVFDCMVFLQAVTNERGPAFACLRLVEEGRLSLVISPQVLSEVQQVLGRTKIRAKFPHLTDERVAGFLQWIEEKGIALDEVPRAFSYARDPNDEPYINLAIAGETRYLVSRDRDLLDLMADEGFRQRLPNLTILDPVALLRELALEPQREQKPEQAPERERGRDINH